MDAIRVLVIWVDGSTSYETLNGSEELNQFMGPVSKVSLKEGEFIYGAYAKKERQSFNSAATEVITELGNKVEPIHGNVIVTGLTKGKKITSVNKVFAEDIVELLEMRIGVENGN